MGVTNYLLTGMILQVVNLSNVIVLHHILGRDIHHDCIYIYIRYTSCWEKVDPNNQWKNEGFEPPKIWVITPKNEGFELPMVDGEYIEKCIKCIKCCWQYIPASSKKGCMNLKGWWFQHPFLLELLPSTLGLHVVSKIKWTLWPGG